ncbi:MAG: 6-phosphogluconolactonase [Spirochaetota bacterium]
MVIRRFSAGAGAATEAGAGAAAEAAWIGAVARDLEAAQARAAAEGRGAEILLSGGSTPEPVYRALASLPLRGPRIRLWLGDERLVPVDDPARNGGLIGRCFSRVAWEGGVEFVSWPAGSREETLGGFSALLSGALGDSPRFDLALLGIGDDGHTAGLFPGDPGSAAALAREPSGTIAPTSAGAKVAFATLAPKEPRQRVSLGLEALARSRILRFLTRGAMKDGVLSLIVSEGGQSYPARQVADRAAELGADLAFYHLEAGA